MEHQQPFSKAMHITLWIAQLLLSGFLLMGAVMKFMPIKNISVMMPWTGQAPEILVRFLGLIDLIAAVGLILPSLLRIKPQLTPWTAIGVLVLMICAITFHLSREEASVIGVNLFAAAFALLIAWGRFKMVPIFEK